MGSLTAECKRDLDSHLQGIREAAWYPNVQCEGIRMPLLEQYLEHADKLAQDVVNAWGNSVTAGNALTPEFNELFDKACTYRTSGVTDNQEKATRQAFAEAYKAFWEKYARS